MGGVNFLNKSKGKEKRWKSRLLLTLNCKLHELEKHLQIKPKSPCKCNSLVDEIFYPFNSHSQLFKNLLKKMCLNSTPFLIQDLISSQWKNNVILSLIYYYLCFRISWIVNLLQGFAFSIPKRKKKGQRNCDIIIILYIWCKWTYISLAYSLQCSHIIKTS